MMRVLLCLILISSTHSEELHSNRFLTASILEGIYGPSSKDIIEDNILSRPNSFGGPCSLMEKIEVQKEDQLINKSSRFYCRNGISESKISPFSTDFQSRFALTKKACDQLAENKDVSNYLYDSLSSANNIEDKISKLILKFYPDMRNSSDFANQIKTQLLDSNTLRFNFLKKYSLTKGLFYNLNSKSIVEKVSHLLCVSEKWQKISKSDNDLQKYIKCHKIFTGTSPKNDNKRLIAIKEKEMSAEMACQELIETAKLGKESKIATPLKNLEGQKVLRTFQSFHNSWFPNYMAYMADDSPILYDIVELEEPAFFLTRALFNSNFSYSTIVQGSDTLKGIRESDHKSDFLITAGSDEKIKKREKYKVMLSKTDSTTWSPTHLDRGTLIGVTEVTTKDILPAHSNQLFFPVFSSTPVDIHKSIGGGILGSNSYILFNNGRPHGNLSDGKKVLMRAYSKNLIRDLLCRDLPVISPEDSIGFINKESKLSWSQDKNCMSCHATMDTMAGLLRNAELIINNVSEQGSSHIKYHQGTKSAPKNAMLFDTIEDYHLTKASGSFVYRDIENNFINTRVDNLDQLGLQISKTRDFYACATTRYFKFLTGKDISITQINDLKDSELKEFINTEISNFKQHQDLQTLIKRIISSKWF
ncbi:hypothetical protein BIY24_01590 [Halobacteriovorax marinus]|uniref:hypothetical protein n=1 Tax=Halobacteriovorax marinus TaxID=97084 RepID=UPI000BC2EDC2|nr:hypothetical protein [Halobacteriovorax marinus]ATH06675.1 hypothetical protein BIY24_01590 [Halobacteriovorax marinus]